jgi:PKD repeat protein
MVSLSVKIPIPVPYVNTKLTLAFLWSLMSVSFVFGQATDRPTFFCGQPAVREKLYHQHPHLQRPVDEITSSANDRGGDTDLYIIPVVFHVIHEGGAENISAEQIQSAIDVLNRDFRKQNADTSAIVDGFVDLAADTDIEFRLATKDPDGDCHPGINRVVSDLTNDGFNDAMKELIYWPRNKYLNIWVCKTIGGNTLGFTNLPGDVSPNWLAWTDGIVVKSDCLGLIETANVAYSRTLTHEIGHWLNLYHTWGPTNSPNEATNCDFDDFVTDTPNTIGYVSCNLNGASCGSDLDNVQNYMEYSFCSRMFTYGQRTRMRNALSSSTAGRNNLHTNSNLIATGVINPPLCLAKFSSNQNSICTGNTVQFFDDSYHGVSDWTWNFGDGNTLTGSDPLVHKDPIHTYTAPGVYTVTLTVGNGNEELNTSISSYITVYPLGQSDSNFEEGFENSWPGGNWSGFNEGGNETWEVTPTASYTGDKSLKLRNFNNNQIGVSDILYSTTYDMSAVDTIYLSYRWAYASKTNETDDKLRISVSGDCGQTWSLRKIRKGLTNLPTVDPQNSQFTPTTLDQWNGETLTLLNEEWFTENFRVKIEFEGLGGNNLYLDDINISSSPSVSVAEINPFLRYQLFPNPSQGTATLVLNNASSDAYLVEVYNMQGALCHTMRSAQGGGTATMEIPQQAAGLYTVKISQGRSKRVAKLIFE